MSILCYSKKAWASCLLGLAVSAVHYSSHHTVKVCSCSVYAPLVISFIMSQRH